MPVSLLFLPRRQDIYSHRKIARLLEMPFSPNTRALVKKLATMQKGYPLACQDIAEQTATLVENASSSRYLERLAHFPRYLKEASLRLEDQG